MSQVPTVHQAREALERVTRFAKYHGVRVLSAKGDFYIPEHVRAPFSPFLGLEWWRAVLYHEDTPMCCARTEVDITIPCSHVAGMLHEVAHLLATKTPPNASDDDDFFAWEYRVAQWLRITRVREIGISAIDPSFMGSRVHLVEAMRDGRRKGNIDHGGRPVIVRVLRDSRAAARARVAARP